MSESKATSSAPLPVYTTEVVGLATADLAISAILLPISGWIAWKHGRVGMVCWPILGFYFATRLVADILLWMDRDGPMTSSAASLMTTAGSISCISLAIIGVVYEANIVLPQTPKRWTEKILLGVTHLTNTVGIGLATYGGSPSATGEGGVLNNKTNQIGNCLELLVMAIVCYWVWPTYKKIVLVRPYPNARPAMNMLRFGVIAIPFQLIRVAYTTIYAFSPVPSLDPVRGSFATKLVLNYGTQNGAAVALIVAGWLGMQIQTKKRIAISEAMHRYDGPSPEGGGMSDYAPFHRNLSNTVELVDPKR